MPDEDATVSTRPHRESRQPSRLTVGLLVALHLVLARPAFQPPANYPVTFATDLVRVQELAELEGRPWRDVDVEYPPLLVVQAEVVATDDINTTGRRFASVQLVLHLVTVAALGWGWGRRGTVAYLLLSAPLLVYPFVLQRSDLLAVALAALAAAAWQRRRDTATGVLLSAAFFAKAWPLVLGGALLTTRRWRALATWCASLAIGGLAWVLYGGADAPVQVLTFRGATGAQIESLAGNLLGHVSDAPWRVEAGAVRVGELPGIVRVGLPALGLGIVAAVWWLVWRRVQSDRAALAFGAGATAAVAGMLATSLLFSTQFTLWLLPWAAVTAAGLPPRAQWTSLPARLDLLAVGLVLLIAAAAGPLMWIHPDVVHGDRGLWLLTARNLCVVALLVVTIRRLLVDDRACGADRSVVGGNQPPLPGFEHHEVRSARGGHNLEACLATVTAAVPPALVEQPGAGPLRDRVRSRAHQQAMWRAAERTAAAHPDGSAIGVAHIAGQRRIVQHGW